MVVLICSSQTISEIEHLFMGLLLAMILLCFAVLICYFTSLHLSSLSYKMGLTVRLHLYIGSQDVINWREKSWTRHLG